MQGRELASIVDVGEGAKTAVLVPLMPFAQARAYLHGSIPPTQCEHIARTLARNILRSARGLRTAVVSRPHSAEVQRFALINGARYLSEPSHEPTTEQSIARAMDDLRELGYERALVVTGDLASVTDLRWLVEDQDVTFVADSTGMGTNAICMPTNLGFPFLLGPDGFATNQETARQLGHDAKAVVDPAGVSCNLTTAQDMVGAGLIAESAIDVHSAQAAH